MIDFFFNELSLDGQFPSPDQALGQVRNLLRMREIILKNGLALRVNGALASRMITKSESVHQLLARDRNLQRVTLQWLTREGPFWENDPLQDESQHITCRGELIRGSSLAEAALLIEMARMAELLSASPSAWEFNPIEVKWEHSKTTSTTIHVPNHWDETSIHGLCKASETPEASWVEFVERAGRQYSHLVVAQDSIDSLRSSPFLPAAVRQLKERLSLLQAIKENFTESGELTEEGMRLHQTGLVGTGAHFSNSSSTEAIQFRERLTFPKPRASSDFLFCPWHAKVRTGQLRMHFSFPITHNEPIYVVYIGPKLTKR